MSNLDDVLKVLEAQENGAELKESVLGAVEAEKQKGIAIKNKVSEEAINNRRYKIAMEELGYNSEKYDIDSFKKEISGKLTKVQELTDKSEKLSETEKRFRNTESMLEELTRKYEDEAAKRQAAEDANRKSTITSKLMQTFADKLPSPDLHVEHLISSGKAKLAEDGKNVYFNIEGEELDYVNGIERYIDQPNVKKYLLTSQRSGSGKGEPNGGNSVTTGESIADRLDRVRKIGKRII